MPSAGLGLTLEIKEEVIAELNAVDTGSLDSACARVGFSDTIGSLGVACVEVTDSSYGDAISQDSRCLSISSKKRFVTGCTVATEKVCLMLCSMARLACGLDNVPVCKEFIECFLDKEPVR